jgi:hypothetical protein
MTPESEREKGIERDIQLVCKGKRFYINQKPLDLDI